MMSSTDSIYNVEEVLVVRVDCSSTILHTIYYKESFGRVAKKIIGKNFFTIGMTPEISEQCLAYLNKVFIRLKKEAFQLQHGCRYYRISYLPEKNSKGQVETVLVIVRDITKEQNLKEDLTVSQAKLQMAQQIAKVGYFCRDIVNDKLYWSDQVYKNFDLVPQENPASIEFFLSLVHPEDVEMMRRGAFQMPPEEFLDVEYRIIKKDGSIGWIHSLIQSVFDNNGQLLKKFGIVQDITKRKLLEIELKGLTEQLQKANKLLAAKQIGIRMAGEIAKLGYFEWDLVKNSIYWSDQQYRNFGYEPQVVTPTRELFRSRILNDDFEIIQKGIAELYEKSYLESQFRVIKADGSLGWFYSRINVITNEQGYRVKIFGITQDITEQKQTEERIHKVEKELNFMNQLYSRSVYLNRLLVKEYPAGQIANALNEIGIKSHIAHCCFVLKLSEKLVDNSEKIEDTITPPIVRKQAVLMWLAERESAWVWSQNGNIVVLVPISDNRTITKESEIEFASHLIAEIEKAFPHFHIKVGISGASNTPMNFRDIYEKAHRAVIIATTMDYSLSIHCDDIGVYEVAFQLLHDKNTCAMVQNTIGRLAEYDEARKSNLLSTLECILEHTSLKMVAQKLFIHHNTVIWRKQKIETFLNMPLDKMETKMLLMLYIKIWNLQKGIL